MIKWLWGGAKVVHDPMLHSAEAAVARAAEDDALVKSKWPVIQALAYELGRMRAENNFAARIRAAYGEGRQ